MLMRNDDIETAIRDMELNRQTIDASELDARDYRLLLAAQKREAEQRTEQARRDSAAVVCDRCGDEVVCDCCDDEVARDEPDFDPEDVPNYERWGSNVSFFSGLILLAAFGMALAWVLGGAK